MYGWVAIFPEISLNSTIVLVSSHLVSRSKHGAGRDCSPVSALLQESGCVVFLVLEQFLGALSWIRKPDIVCWFVSSGMDEEARMRNLFAVFVSPALVAWFPG